MKRILRVSSCLALAWWLGGCSTLQGDFHQNLQIDALDAQNHPVSGMQCQVGSGTSAKAVVTPATVRVRRAMAPLEVECRRDSLVATATVKSRRERMEEALLPFGSVGIFVDHLSGSLYSYPTAIHLRVGQHLVLEHGGEAQVASADAIPLAPPPVAGSTSAQRTALAAAQPTPPVQRTVLAAAQPAPPAQRTASATVPSPAKPATASSRRAAASARKPQATAVSKSDRATVKPVNSVSTAATTTKPRTGSSKIAVTAPAAAVAVPSAPINW